ncbi:glycosyl transferase [Marinilabiliaceae bacterium ANBcel2]|nr:glycosyl transferase [Marinilabiliaceae bacterium ANBcel2]
MNNKTTFLTFNESVNGVYISQVIEVVNYYQELGISTNIIAFFSIRDFLKNRKLLKHYLPNSIVLPSIGRIKHWKWNGLWLKLFSKELKGQTIICRGALATNLAIDHLNKSKIVYDGRGAIWAEQLEYGVFNGTGIENNLFDIEKKAVLRSQGRIAVSSQLVDYWCKNFGYKDHNHVIIPCTLSIKKELTDNNVPDNLNKFLNDHQDGVICVFSGGNGKWQQLDKVCSFAENIVGKQGNIAFLFLSPTSPEISKLIEKFPDRIFNTLIKPKLIITVLKKCDYGIVLREKNTTNRVASPVKIAEYLYAGLKVIISPNVGDYSELITANNFGYIHNEQYCENLSKPSTADKNKIHLFAELSLTKSAFEKKFLLLT